MNITAPTMGPGSTHSPGMRSMPARPVSCELTNKIHLAAAFSTQIAGHAAGNPNLLDLTNFSRNKARLRALFEF